MSLNCGDEILFRDLTGANITRFVWFCRGRWIALQTFGIFKDLGHPLYMHNGTIMTWQGVLAYLMKGAKLAGSEGQMYGAQGSKGHYVQLGQIVRVSELAAVLGEPAEDVRAELKDLVLQVSDEAG